jgi:hypothetical protein
MARVPKGDVVPSASLLTENVPGPAGKDRFRLIDAHMKCLWPSECGCVVRKKEGEHNEKREAFFKNTAPPLRVESSLLKKPIPQEKKRENEKKTRKEMQKQRSTGPSRVVPHRSATPARTCLTQA